jgi:xanthine dehydrogenase accessory factor
MSDIVTVTDAARAVLAVAEGGAGVRAVAVVMAVSADGAAQRMLVDASGSARGTMGDAWLDDAALQRAQAALEQGAREPVVERVEHAGASRLLCIQVCAPPERLLIVGAGHIAVPLAELGVLLGFQVTVLDDREEFASTERFAGAVTVLRSDFASDPFAGVAVDAHSYIALVTRGHRWDFDCLRRLIAADVRPRYIGMIGSRRRVRAAFEALLAAGTPRAALAGIHAPIGIEIGAETPAEIAVAIAAELVAVRRGADTDTTASRERVLDRLIGERRA